MAAAKPAMQLLKQVMDISRMCARRPNTADPAAKARASDHLLRKELLPMV